MHVWLNFHVHNSWHTLCGVTSLPVCLGTRPRMVLCTRNSLSRRAMVLCTCNSHNFDSNRVWQSLSVIKCGNNWQWSSIATIVSDQVLSVIERGNDCQWSSVATIDSDWVWQWLSVIERGNDCQWSSVATIVSDQASWALREWVLTEFNISLIVRWGRAKWSCWTYLTSRPSSTSTIWSLTVKPHIISDQKWKHAEEWGYAKLIHYTLC